MNQCTKYDLINKYFNIYQVIFGQTCHNYIKVFTTYIQFKIKWSLLSITIKVIVFINFLFHCYLNEIIYKHSGNISNYLFIMLLTMILKKQAYEYKILRQLVSLLNKYFNQHI